MIESLLSIFAACSSSSIPFLPTWYKYLPSETDSTGRCTPIINFPHDINRILLAVFEIVLVVGGIVAVVFIFVGGFQYLVSQGEPDRAKNARTTIFNAIVGLIITMLATGIVNLVARNL